MTPEGGVPSLRLGPGQIQEVESAPGLEIWRGQHGVVALTWNRKATRLTVGTHGQTELAAIVVRRWEQVLAQTNGSLMLLADFGHMPTYDSKFRIVLTEWAVKHRSALKVHLLSLSKIVSMGATLANIAVGGIISVHHERAPFERVAVTFGLGSPPKVT
jgi:hypothetical protein